MARITIEDCLKRVENRFKLVNAAAQRVRQIREGSEYLVVSPKNEDIVVSLREIAAGRVLVQQEIAEPEEAEAKEVEAEEAEAKEGEAEEAEAKDAEAEEAEAKEAEAEEAEAEEAKAKKSEAKETKAKKAKAKEAEAKKEETDKSD